MGNPQALTAWAHSLNDDGKRHVLVDHLSGTARLASGFAARFGGERAAWWAGLWHDIGKFACAWQHYLLAREAGRPAPRLDHKIPGALVARPSRLDPALIPSRLRFSAITLVAAAIASSADDPAVSIAP